MILPLLQKARRKPLVFGHRGASEDYPENTILSFDMAMRQGAAGIETDLQFTKDGRIVCFHDTWLGRLTGTLGSIHSSTLRELSKLRVRHKKTVPQAIPTLHSLLEWLPPQSLLMLELKDRRFNRFEKLDSLLTLLDSDVFQRTILASFDKSILEKAKRIAPSLVTCHITWRNFTPTATTEISAPLFPILWINPLYVARAHTANAYVSVWDPHPENRIQHYLDYQIDIVTGDNPRKIVAALNLTKEAGESHETAQEDRS